MPGSPASPTGAAGRYFDGATADAHAVTVLATPTVLRACGADGREMLAWPVARVIRLPDGAEGMETLTVSGSMARLVVPRMALPPALMRRRRLPVLGIAAGGVLMGTIVALLSFAEVPAAVERPLGNALRRAVLAGARPCQGAAGHAALGGLAARLSATARIADPVRVYVVSAPEVNAYTLPGHQIVVLSGLIEATNARGMAGVMAHEIGHVAARDPIHGLARGLGLLAIEAISGQALVAQIGQFGLLAYDRSVEARADAFAVALLRDAGLRADGLSSFLAGLEAGQQPGSAWLSDHPALKDRIRATATGPDGAEPMTDAEWGAVRAMCAATG